METGERKEGQLMREGRDVDQKGEEEVKLSSKKPTGLATAVGAAAVEEEVLADFRVGSVASLTALGMLGGREEGRGWELRAIRSALDSTRGGVLKPEGELVSADLPKSSWKIFPSSKRNQF